MSFPSLVFYRRGQTWFVKHRDNTFPLILSARDIYYGTGRLLATMSLDRHDEGSQSDTRILTSSVDLLVASQRTRFAKEANERLSQGGPSVNLITPVTVLLDAMEERVTEARDEIDRAYLDRVVLPDDMTPKYIVWPFVPVARPGMLVAPSGSGKSALAGLIAITCISGIEILDGVVPHDPGPVVYIGQEEDAYQMRVRIEMMLRGHQLDRQKILSNFIYVKLRGGSLINSAERVAELCAEVHAKMIVVDSAQATWGSEKQEGVRDYASSWFNAVELIEVPALIVEHPNAFGTKKDDGLGWAAGTSVKRDRAGHVWGVRSTEIPTSDGAPRRYHVKLVDSKRNYVARQKDINYEVLMHGYEWTKFVIAGDLSPQAVVEASRMFGAIAAIMRDDKEHEEGWTIAELMERLKHKDDRRIRQEVNLDFWRPAPWNDALEATFRQVEGTGGKGNPARYTLETRIKPADQIELSMAPGDPDDLIN